jgi:hypothetical protein
MRFIGLAILLATTTAAQTPREGDMERVSYTAPMTKPTPRPAWIELATPTPARYGTEYILVGREAGRFTQLRIEAPFGVYVESVVIRYADAKQKHVAGGYRLDVKHPLILDVEAKPIDTVIVTTDRHGTGSYRVLGAPAPGSAALR